MADEHGKGCKRGFETVPLAENDDGSFVSLAHTADHRFMMGELRPVKEGEALPPGARLVRRREEDGAYVDVPFEAKAGPALVNSASFRAGWGRIFGGNKTPEVGQA